MNERNSSENIKESVQKHTNAHMITLIKHTKRWINLKKVEKSINEQNNQIISNFVGYSPNEMRYIETNSP